MNLSNASLEKNFASRWLRRERFLNALASLPASDLKEMKDEDHGGSTYKSAKHTTFDRKWLGELIRDKS